MPIDLNGHVWGSVLLCGAGASYVLRAADGSLLALEDLTSSTVAPDAVFQTFTLTTPPPGNVTVELTAAASPATVNFELTFENGKRLAIGASPVLAVQNDPVHIVLCLRDRRDRILPGASPSISAWIQAPGSSPQAVPVFDDGLNGDGAAGDGVFAGSFSGTSVSGSYIVTCTGSASFGTQVVARTGETLFAVAPSGITLNGAPVQSFPDADGDGRFDGLVFTQSVTLAAPRSVSITAELRDSNDALIARARKEVSGPAAAGTYALDLVFAAEDIVRHGVDGPWTIPAITAYDLDSDGLSAASGPSLTSAPFAVSAFQPPALPAISHIFPSSGPQGGGSVVMLYGSTLLDTTSVSVGGRAAVFVVTGDDSLQVTIPAPHAGGGGGIVPLSDKMVDVRVVTPWGVAVATGAYTYTALSPR